jgi:L-lactate dehydrogenase complex protein LldE
MTFFVSYAIVQSLNLRDPFDSDLALKISLFIPCYVDQISPHVGIAMVNVLERLGHTVDYPSGQTCCGQPAFNSGYFDEARSVAEHFLNTFADCDVIGVPSGSCTAMVRKFYPELFQDSARADEVKQLTERTFEFSELLVDKLGVTDVGAKFDATATYHDGCHGLRELGIKDAPRQLLEKVEGLKLVEMDEAQSCCGFGGTFAVKFPQISTAMTQVKLGSATQTQADYLISGDPSCLMQIKGYFNRQSSPMQCLHLAEVLDRQ